MKWQDTVPELKTYLVGIYVVGIPLALFSLTATGNNYSSQWALLTVAVLFVATVGVRLPKTDAAVISMGDVFTILALIQFGPGPALVVPVKQTVPYRASFEHVGLFEECRMRRRSR